MDKKNVIDKPKCFGTIEYNTISLICKRCRVIDECEKKEPKTKRDKKTVCRIDKQNNYL